MLLSQDAAAILRAAYRTAARLRIPRCDTAATITSGVSTQHSQGTLHNSFHFRSALLHLLCCSIGTSASGVSPALRSYVFASDHVKGHLRFSPGLALVAYRSIVLFGCDAGIPRRRRLPSPLSKSLAYLQFRWHVEHKSVECIPVQRRLHALGRRFCDALSFAHVFARVDHRRTLATYTFASDIDAVHSYPLRLHPSRAYVFLLLRILPSARSRRPPAAAARSSSGPFTPITSSLALTSTVFPPSPTYVSECAPKDDRGRITDCF
jgi:hypothetical protein